MKLGICLIITIALQAQTPNVAASQVAQELNEAARAYREGKFAEAQVHSERALLLDPQNKTAPFFVARTIHAQYKPGDFTPENVTKAREAIIAYKKVLERFAGDEEAYKAIAYLYSAIKEEELLRDWLMKRASDTTVANQKRAEAFIVLASKDWDCSFKITDLPGNKVTTVTRNKQPVSYRMPKKRLDFEQARECANRGMELVDMAIALTPENESAWAYKTNLILELAKLAEMLGEAQQKTELLRKHDEALKETTRLAKRAQSNNP